MTTYREMAEVPRDDVAKPKRRPQTNLWVYRTWIGLGVLCVVLNAAVAIMSTTLTKRLIWSGATMGWLVATVLNVSTARRLRRTEALLDELQEQTNERLEKMSRSADDFLQSVARLRT